MAMATRAAFRYPRIRVAILSVPLPVGGPQRRASVGDPAHVKQQSAITDSDIGEYREQDRFLPVSPRHCGHVRPPHAQFIVLTPMSLLLIDC